MISEPHDSQEEGEKDGEKALTCGNTELVNHRQNDEQKVQKKERMKEWKEGITHEN